MVSVLITGTSSGIGMATALALGRAALREKLLVTVLPMDVDSDNFVCDGMGSVEELPLSLFRAVMATTYFGVIQCTQALLPTRPPSSR